MSQDSPTPTPTGAVEPPDAAVLGDLHEVRGRLDQLRDEVHSILTEHFTDSVGELRQVQGLVRDAALRLIPEFRNLSERARESASLARRIANGETDARDLLEDVVLSIDASSRGVTQSLQFEDVANQLLDHCDRRLSRLVEFARDMSLLRADAPGIPVGVSAGEIADLEERLVVHRLRLENTRQNAVRQQSVESGTVDLF